MWFCFLQFYSVVCLKYYTGNIFIIQKWGSAAVQQSVLLPYRDMYMRGSAVAQQNNPAQSQFVLEGAKPLCTARVVAVVDNGSRYARIYNMGTSVCVFNRVYAIYRGAAVASGSIYLRVEPGQMNSTTATLSYNPSWVYRLTQRGEVAEERP